MPQTDTRPAVLSREACEVLNELRGFRHVFRHAYDYDLDADRVRRLAIRVRSGWPRIHGEVRGFRVAILRGTEQEADGQPPATS